MPTTNPLAALKRRLEKAELDHLRNHAGELASRLERAEEELSSAWAAADMWREDHLRLMQDMAEQGATIGLTKEGVIGVLATQPQTYPIAIGEKWPGTDAIYAGISLSSDETHAVHLIAWPESTTEPLDHAAATAEAERINPEYNSHLPTRIQAITLFNNLKSHYVATDWHWTSTKIESQKAAFVQGFNYGNQVDVSLSAECRVRAVSEIQL